MRQLRCGKLERSPHPNPHPPNEIIYKKLTLSEINYLYAWNTEDLTFKYFFGKSFLLDKGVYNLKESEKPENTNSSPVPLKATLIALPHIWCDIKWFQHSTGLSRRRFCKVFLLFSGDYRRG
jgi:hypothetical protein